MVVDKDTNSSLVWEKKWFVLETDRDGDPIKKHLECYFVSAPERGYVVKRGCVRDFCPADKCYQTGQEADAKIAELQSIMGVREQLAAYAHEAWSGWMKYMFSKCHDGLGDGLAIDKELVERWTRQMNTPYAELPETEKISDRDEAHKMLEIMAKAGAPPAPKP